MSTRFKVDEFDRRLSLRGLSGKELQAQLHLGPNTLARIRRGDAVRASTAARIVRFFQETPVVPGLEELTV